jgi:hypothetical protein
MLPAGLAYLDSWITADLTTCFQLMETDDFARFTEWTRRWDDLTDFEIVPVMTSQETSTKALATE